LSYCCFIVGYANLNDAICPSNLPLEFAGIDYAFIIAIAQRGFRLMIRTLMTRIFVGELEFWMMPVTKMVSTFDNTVLLLAMPL
jgi:hypothetical protein